ncbi:metallophosphoesterase family protein [Devosia sp.]|uniref:metallophosphoesterase family protein n=1 Tax=Devosia sp. TaxID=1871048 RepID=UPI001ACCC977|nr:metallophosphoesterase family protein [Devosia sp.]MBN9308887.1 metallophosphoesterase family protein [Devosia sp.]
MRIAVISDVHGNRLALEAVEADIAMVGVDATINLGDLFAGPLDPIGAADLLIERDYPTVIGNHDRYIAHGLPQSKQPVDRFVTERLKPVHLEYLRSLPATRDIEGEVFLCHGTPASDEEPWLDGWWTGRTVTMPGEAEVTAKADGLEFPVLLCGHTHVSRIVRLRDGRLVVNPGSVGLQFNYGAPDARYAVLERHGGRWAASIRAVPYDFEAVAQQAIANGFPHWADVMRTGWPSAIGLF